MTGLLAFTGIVIVLLASAYSGLSSDEAESLSSPGIEITPVRNVDSTPDGATPDDAAGEAGEADGAPEPAATPEAEAPAPEPTQVLNRLDCNQIRGTQYFSPEERTWFLSNCVN